MNQTLHFSQEARLRHKQKREGAALLIVLFILMLSTGTAVFALQSTQFEQRAAGALQQSMRTKYIAEAATVSVLGFCFELGTTGCADLKRSNGDYATSRARYALPSWGAAEPVAEIFPSDLAGNSWLAASALLPDDATLSSSASAPYTPTFSTVMEKWKVPNPGETRQRFRLIVSTYGSLGLTGDSTGTGELRTGHESISATRAFFDVR